MVLGGGENPCSFENLPLEKIQQVEVCKAQVRERVTSTGIVADQ